MNVASAESTSLLGPTRLVVHGVEGTGKGHTPETPILTPDGFRQLGDLRVGDAVIGSDGAPTEVTGVFPRGVIKIYRVTMTDGTSTVVDGEHLWLTTKVGDRDKLAKVRSTMEIAETLHRAVSGPHAPQDGKYPLHRVQTVSPVEFNSIAPLKIDPYVLGAYLGDGSTAVASSSVVITKPEMDVIERVSSKLRADDYSAPVNSNGKIVGVRINGKHTYSCLEELGLVGVDSLNKFIPPAYLFASVADRIELLRGLCDTDGSVASNGSRIEYGTSSRRLRDDFIFLARSLGAIVTWTERVPHYTYKGERLNGALSWRILVSMPHGDIVPVSSDKHLAKWAGAKFQNYRAIDSVEPIGESEVICIKVAAADSLYVCEDFIVTHNTTIAAYFPKPIFLCGEDSFPRDLPFRPKRFATPRNWADVLAAIESLRVDPHDYETLAIDTLDWLEPLLHQFVCARDTGRKSNVNKNGHVLISIEDYGYGIGYTVAAEEMRKFLDALSRLHHERGMHIVLLMHSHQKKVNNLSGTDFDAWKPKINNLSARLVVEWAETVAFIYFEMDGVKLGNETRAKGVATGRRFLGVRNHALYDAKNRMNLASPLEYNEPNDMIPCLLGEHLDPRSLVSPTKPPTPRAYSFAKSAKGEATAAPAQREQPAQVAAVSTVAPAAAQPPPARVSETPKVAEVAAASVAATSKSEAMDGELLLGLTNAIARAKNQGDDYHAAAQKWMKKAEAISDPSEKILRIKSIIARIERETAPLTINA